MFDKMIEEIKTLSAISENQLDNSLTNRFSTAEINKLIKIIAENNIESIVYKDCPNIQNELIKNDDFLYFVKKMTSHTIYKSKFLNNLIFILASKGKSITNYDCYLFEFLYENNSANEQIQDINTDFLEKCRDKYMADDTILKIILGNIRYYYKDLSSGSVSNFTDDEFEVFSEPWVTSFLPAHKKSIEKICCILSENEEIKNLLRLLYKREAACILTVNAFEIMTNEKVIERLNYIIDKIDSGNILTAFLQFWKADEYPVRELEIFERLCMKESKENIDNALSSRIKYLNVVYGNRYPFISELDDYTVQSKKESLYIYAVTANKKAFLKLLENNRELFASVSESSILFNEDFRKHININSLNVRDIEMLKDMKKYANVRMLWNKDRSYTFNEIRELYDCDNNCKEFYFQLSIPRIDDKLLILRQVKKHSLTSACDRDETKIKILADKLSIKSIYKWMEEEFSGIKALEIENAARLLLIFDDRKNLISQIQNNEEAMFLINNHNNEMLAGINDMNYIRSNLLEIDVKWKRLKKYLKLTKEYISENYDNIMNFCLRNGADIAVQYYESYNLSDSQQESFLKVVKAELSGKFYMLKYHGSDLSLELQTPVSELQKGLWIDNNTEQFDNIKITEADDFFSTMLLGIKPTRTCIAYNNGQYLECLLSNFDSNKKIIYVYINEKIVGRAILRFTKGCYKYESSMENNSMLKFIDVDDTENSSDTDSRVRNRELPILFLERPYFSGINSELTLKIKEKIVDFVIKKAGKMDVMPVISYDDYKNIFMNKNTLIRQDFNVFISLSKAGKQYLDSLGGSVKISDEGKYYNGLFYLPARK